LTAAERDSHDVRDQAWFWRLDSAAKLLGIIAFVTATALLTDTYLLVASASAAFALAIVSGVPYLRLAKAYATAVPFVALASLSIFLFSGIDQGVNMVVRTSSCVLALLVMANGTDTFDLFAGLRRLKVPTHLTTILMLTQKYVLLLSDELARMKVARRARGFAPGRSLLDRYGLRVLSQTAGMVFVRSSGRAQRTYEGMKSRGFVGEMLIWRRSRTTMLDMAFVSVMLTASVALLLLQLGVVA
jgi:cobalt/nickel transport system permease protein